MPYLMYYTKQSCRVTWEEEHQIRSAKTLLARLTAKAGWHGRRLERELRDSRVTGRESTVKPITASAPPSKNRRKTKRPSVAARAAVKKGEKKYRLFLLSLVREIEKIEADEKAKLAKEPKTCTYQKLHGRMSRALRCDNCGWTPVSFVPRKLTPVPAGESRSVPRLNSQPGYSQSPAVGPGKFVDVRYQALMASGFGTWLANNVYTSSSTKVGGVGIDVLKPVDQWRNPLVAPVPPPPVPSTEVSPEWAAVRAELDEQRRRERETGFGRRGVFVRTTDEP